MVEIQIYLFQTIFSSPKTITISKKNVFLPPKTEVMKICNLIGLLFFALVVFSCQKPVEYPIEPRIEYQGFTYLFNADSTFSGEGVISFSYTDGDGDLGLDDADTAYPFGFHDAHYYNMVVDYLKCVNGEFVKTPLLSPHVPTSPADTMVLYDTVSFNARFKRLRDSEEPKAISGTMDYKLMVQNPLSPKDTIKFEIHILDRALHESNTIQTEAIYNPPILGNKSHKNL
jgi:hypothetical protein